MSEYKSTRRSVYKNVPENSLVELMESRGYEVTKRGWPDFLCFKNGELVCVEVKPNPGHGLRRSQSKAMRYLAAAGIKCYYWAPGMELKRIYPVWGKEYRKWEAS